MKKEAKTKKSKWLWIVLPIVAVLVAAGVILTLVLLNNNEQEDTGPKLYWNLNRTDYVSKESPLSTRQAAADGIYYIKFVVDGKQVEYRVKEKKLVNAIDGMDVMGLQFDEEGFVAGVVEPKKIFNVFGEKLSVQQVNSDSIIANSSYAMNGRKTTIKLSPETKIYNVSVRGDAAGAEIKASDLGTMDNIYVYGTLIPDGAPEGTESVVTHIFLGERPVESKVYWRAEQFYNSSKKETTRIPDKDGVYSIDFFVDGERVTLKCRDKSIVTNIDWAQKDWCHNGLEFDENGFIINVVNSYLGSRTLNMCERFEIIEWNDEDRSFYAESHLTDDGSTLEGVIPADCPIYDVSKAALAEGAQNRRVDSLQAGDRVCIFSDISGKPVLVYVSNRMVDEPYFWNVSRKYSSANKLTTRVPNADGYYEIELLKAGDTKKTMYYTKDVALATAVDVTADRVVGIKADENNIIQYVYDLECIFGNTYFCRGYFITNVNGNLATYLSSSGSGWSLPGNMRSDAEVWNISTHGTYGAKTELQVGDYVYGFQDARKQVVCVYVSRRFLGNESMYYRLDSSQYDSTAKATKRTPDAEGYYSFKMLNYKGETVTIKTKDKKVANFMDSNGPMSLVVRNGICTEANSAAYASGGASYSSYVVKEFTDEGVVIANSTREVTLKMRVDPATRIYNVSDAILDHKGEKTSLKVGDTVIAYYDWNIEAAFIYVTGREANKMAWPVEYKYDSAAAKSTRVPDANGWFYVDLAVDGKVRTYKTKNQNVINAIDMNITGFGIKTSGDEILYATASRWVTGVLQNGTTGTTVKSVSGKTVNTIYTLGSKNKTGTTEKIQLSSNVKIYDVSPTAKNFGEAVKLQPGDFIRTYKSKDEKDTHLYVYVLSHDERKDGYHSYCSHCDKVVYWNPYTAGMYAATYNTHYYLPADVNMNAQFNIGTTARDIEIVLDLYGHTMTRVGNRAVLARYDDTLTIMDSVGGGAIQTLSSATIGGVVSASGEKTVLNFLGGTIKAGQAEGEEVYSYRGGLVYISGGATFNMYDGLLEGGVVKATASSEALGGSVTVWSGTFNMYDGKITGGKAYTVDDKIGGGGNFYIRQGGTVNLIKGTVENGTADYRGGNIYAANGSALNISKDVVVSGGVVGDRGGNILSENAQVTIAGKVVDGKTTASRGGNIYATGMKGMLTINDGAEITGGEGGSNGGNIFLMYSNMTMNGGVISGGNANSGANIYSTGTASAGYSTITLAGGTIKDGDVNLTGGTDEETAKYPDYRSVVIIKGGKIEDTLKLGNAKSVTIGGNPVISKLVVGEPLTVAAMDASASVTVEFNGVFTKPGAGAYVANFHAADPDMIVVAEADGALKVYNPNATAGSCEHCGSSNVLWTPWNGTTTSAGHYILTEDKTLADVITVPGDMVIDLNGYTITAAENKRAFTVSTTGELSILDTSAGKSGTITGGNVDASDLNGRGGNIYVTGGVFNLYSGNITDGIAGGYGGGNLYATGGGTINIKGGKVSGGVANGVVGDNIYVMYSNLNISGGEIIASSDPSVCANGSGSKTSTVVISGGKLTGYDATSTNLKVTSSLATLEITGGELGGVTEVRDFTLSGTPVIDSLKLSTDKVVTVGELATGASIKINATSGVFTAEMTNAADVVTYFDAVDSKYNVAVSAAGNTLEVVEDPNAPTEPDTGSNAVCTHCGTVPTEWIVWDGTEKPAAGGHYYIESSLTLTGRITISDAMDICLDLRGNTLTAKANGYTNAFTLNNAEASLNIMDTTKSGSSAILGSGTAMLYDGGVIHVTAGEMNIYDITVSGGTGTTKLGGNVWVAAGSVFNAKNCLITGGSAYRGGNIYSDGTVTLIDTIVSNGVANNNTGGANIYNNAGTLNLKGTTTLSGGKNTSAYSSYPAGTNILSAGGTVNIYEGVKVETCADVVEGRQRYDIQTTGTAAINLYGGELDNLNVTANVVVNMYGGKVSNLNNAGTVNVYNGQFGAVSAAVTAATCTTPNAEGTLFHHAPGVCATCGKTYVNASTGNENEYVVAHSFAEGVCTVPGCGVGDPAYITKCTHCGNAPAEWVAWDGTGDLPDASHICLTADATVSAKWIAGEKTVCLDLNGHTITAGTRALSVNGASAVLNIMDTTKSGGAIVGSDSAVDDNGGVLYVTGGGTLNLYDITVSGGKVTIGSMAGGNIMVNTDSTLNVNNCIITGGSAKQGGNIYSKGTVTIVDSQILDGVGGTNNCGANIYNDGGTLTLKGVTAVSGGNYPGSTYPQGTNIFNNGAATLNIYEGVKIVTGADVATSRKDRDVAAMGTTTVNMYGGSVDNLYINTSAVCNMYGGYVGNLKKSGTVTVYNGQFGAVSAAVTAATCTTPNAEGTLFHHAPGTCATCSKTYVNATTGNENEYVIAHSFASGACSVTGCGVADPRLSTTCTHCGTVPTWVEFTSAVTTSTLVDGAHYYLTDDVTMTGCIWSNGKNFCLDLNGYTITARENYPIIAARTSSIVNVMDTTMTHGTLLGNGTGTMNGGVLSVIGADVNLYDITIRDGKVGDTYLGGNIYAGKSSAGIAANVTMTNTKVINGSAGNGGNVYVKDSTVTVKGTSLISGGTVIATGNGSNAYLAQGAVLTLDGGKIKDESNTVYTEPTA